MGFDFRFHFGFRIGERGENVLLEPTRGFGRRLFEPSNEVRRFLRPISADFPSDFAVVGAFGDGGSERERLLFVRFRFEPNESRPQNREVDERRPNRVERIGRVASRLSFVKVAEFLDFARRDKFVDVSREESEPRRRG